MLHESISIVIIFVKRFLIIIILDDKITKKSVGLFLFYNLSFYFCQSFHYQFACPLSFSMNANGYVYETFGISKRFSIKLQLLLIRAVTHDNAMSAKCFIHVVVRSVFFFRLDFLSFARWNRHTLCQVLAFGSAGATWQCVWLFSIGNIYF